MLREELKLTQDKFAEPLNIKGGAVSNMELGKSNPSKAVLDLIEIKYHINRNWLLTGKGEKYIKGSECDTCIYKVGDREPEHFHPKPVRLSPDRERFEPLDEFTYVNSTKLRFNAGDGAFVLEENIKKTHVFRNKWLSRIATSKENVLIIEIYGDSMEPTIFDGDTIMIDRGRNEIHSGCIYAIGIDETVMIKRLETLPDKTIRIISDNKELYQPFKVNIEKIRVFGRVIWIAHQLVKG